MRVFGRPVYITPQSLGLGRLENEDRIPAELDAILKRPMRAHPRIPQIPVRSLFYGNTIPILKTILNPSVVEVYVEVEGFRPGY